MYGQPHQGYGMSPQSSYDQSSSPANASGFGQHSMPPREGALGAGGVSAYGRSGSAQPSESQQHPTNSSAFGGMPDVFGRSQSGYPGQTQPLHQQHGAQPGSNDESQKPYGELKGAGAPNPLLSQPGRPGSAANLPGQSGLPPPLSHQNQQTFGGYPSHLNHQMHAQQGSQYGAALGGHSGHHQAGGQNHQGSGYGNYGGGQFGGSYYGSSGRGGWGGNYGH